MEQVVSLLLLLAAAVGVAAPIFLSARKKARTSAAVRRGMIMRGVIGLGVGLFIALWLPTRVPETPGSPGTIVMLLLLWFIGGGIAYQSVAYLAGAVAGKPQPEDLPS